MNGKPSEPLVVTWPGILQPVITRVPAVSSSSVKVVWEKPETTDGVKIKQYKMVCLDEKTQKVVQSTAPIHPEAREAEMHNLTMNTYLLYLEVYLHGTMDVVHSDTIRFKPQILPDAPHITVTVVGLEERRQIEKVTCDLLSKRDCLLSALSNGSTSLGFKDTDNSQIQAKLTDSLLQVDDMLDDCLSSLDHYTGHLLAHVSWTCPQSNSDIRVTGYKVLVDGKQYGTTLHSGVKNVRIKLGLEETSHRISMVSVCDNPRTTSCESNGVELLTQPFLPFTFFCFHSVHIKHVKVGNHIYVWPSTGCCHFKDTIAMERNTISRRPIHQGLLKKQVPPPSCSLLDIFDGEYKPLFSPSGPRGITVILFWTYWCLSSQKALSSFVQFAKKFRSDYDFIAISCSATNTPQERQELVHAITKCGWREDKCLRHCTSLSVDKPTQASKIISQSKGELVHGSCVDITELFGISGTPMVVIVHPNDYIAWQGRFCAFDYSSYENFLRYAISETLQEDPTIPDPWNTSIDTDALSGTQKRRLVTDNNTLIHRPLPTRSTGVTQTYATSAPNKVMNGQAFVPKTPSKLFYKSNLQKKSESRITVNSRPFSASHMTDSPYAARNAGMAGRRGSARTRRTAALF